ncbi:MULTISPECIES: cysteine desulfurase family protein [unclassified Bacillus (in: firmicutes)]|uniref:cysteine desulfurase family protein n=1 Tax=unclassified Bacillus (in: firmicutes) TaxID=185979 RepID=UPI0008E36F05|nr:MULTISPECIES: cysteine desulfurase family protein [unclassified Bacillus (in: firmicutes)]SFA94810.1 cysteine desulfurase [Bacillus sp. UNCCL13]SFQ78675.1 cysteine desulfurase [Bacillus sp. cl95]
MERIYLDHAATSPMHPSVIDTLVETMNQQFGNPSSIHFFGREARHIVDESRHVMARSINAKHSEIIFTSGGTEADNLAIIGIADAYQGAGKHIITSSIEHHAVLHACHELDKKGFEVTYLPVDETGMISLHDLKEALRPDTILVSVMFGNNEVGTLQPISEIGILLEEHQAFLHTDAVQAYGIEKIDVKESKIDLMSVSAHKLNGPKGIGFLYAREGIKLSPRQFGGEQEKKRRAGTENVTSIAGFKKAIEISHQELEVKRERYIRFKELFMKRLRNNEVVFQQNGNVENSLPHVLNLSFPGTNVESLLVNMDLAGLAVSSGSACTAGSIDPSHVLVAMFGKESDRITNSVRFSFGIFNTEEQIEKAAEETSKIIRRLAK